MVDNRGISPVSNYFKPGDANSMANKMSDEKMGQGGEYFASEMEEEQIKEESFQDRSAQLKASLNGLAAANFGSIHFRKTLKDNKLRKKEEHDDTKIEAILSEEDNQEN